MCLTFERLYRPGNNLLRWIATQFPSCVLRLAVRALVQTPAKDDIHESLSISWHLQRKFCTTNRSPQPFIPVQLLHDFFKFQVSIISQIWWSIWKRNILRKLPCVYGDDFNQRILADLREAERCATGLFTIYFFLAKKFHRMTWGNYEIETIEWSSNLFQRNIKKLKCCTFQKLFWPSLVSKLNSICQTLF